MPDDSQDNDKSSSIIDNDPEFVDLLNGNTKYVTKYDNPSSVSMCIGEHFDAETDMKYSETSQDDDEGCNSSQTSDDSKKQPPEFGIQDPLDGNMKYDTKYDNPSSVSMCIGEHFDIEIDMKYSEMSQDDDEGSNSSQSSDDSKEEPPEFGIQDPLNGQESEGQNSLHKQNPLKEKKNEQDDISCGTKVCGSNLCNKNMDAGIGRTEMKCLNAPQDDDSSSSNSNDFPYSDCPKKIPLNGQYPDADPESQNFLSDHNPSKKKYEAEYHQGTASFGMSVFNLGNAIMGSGILGLSFAMANTGIAQFVFLLVFIAIFSLYSVHLLLKTADGAGALVYESLGQKAFGIPGKLAASCSITMQNIGAMSSYLYIIKYELPIVIQSFTGANDGEWYINGDYLVILVSIIILPLTLLRNLGYLGYTSGLSLLCMVFFVIVVIIKKFQMPCPLPLPDSGNETFHMFNIPPHSNNITTDDDTCKPKYFVFNLQTVYAIPILTFAFVCHPTILPMYKELKDRSRQKMQNVANVSFLAMFIMYLLAALFGYLTFNIHVGPELLHTYSKYYKYDILLLVVRLAVLAAVTLTVPVMLFPIRISVGHLLFPGKDFSWIRHTIITLILLAGTNILVIFVPSIRDIFGFIGAFAGTMLIFILPSTFYLKLVKKESFKSRQKIRAMMFLILGFVVMIVCMTFIIYDWIMNSMKDQGH